VQEELDSLEEEKASELWEAQEELRVAQEEVQELQQAAEEAAAERENDIALLQEELCRLRAELERLRGTTQEYELELTTLRAEISMKNQRREEKDRAGGEGLIPHHNIGSNYRDIEKDQFIPASSLVDTG